MNKAVFIDADDTLWSLDYHYKGIITRVAKEIAEELSMDPVVVRSTICKYDKLYMEEAGLCRRNFPTAIVKAYEHLTGQETLPVDRILDLYNKADRVYECKLTIKDGVIETLQALKAQGYKIYILTSGDDIIQSSKIYRTGIWQYIDDTIISNKKTTRTYTSAASQYEAEQYIMVGNSMASDIEPALKAGWHAIYIPAGSEEYDPDLSKYIDKIFPVDNFTEIIPIINNIHKGTDHNAE